MSVQTTDRGVIFFVCDVCGKVEVGFDTRKQAGTAEQLHMLVHIYPPES